MTKEGFWNIKSLFVRAKQLYQSIDLAAQGGRPWNMHLQFHRIPLYPTPWRGGLMKLRIVNLNGGRERRESGRWKGKMT